MMTLKRLKKAAEDPRRIMFFFMGKIRQFMIAVRTSAFIRSNDLQRLAEELTRTKLMHRLEGELTVFDGIEDKSRHGEWWFHGAISKQTALCLYGILRKRKPETVVETGVCNGFSTAIILLALEKNGGGRLYSIDDPRNAGEGADARTRRVGWRGPVVKPGREVGWLVPQKLRPRWTLIPGRSQDEFPKLVRGLRSVDFFFHDSEHTYECMMMEFRSVWDRLSPGAVLLSDNVNSNDAFTDFSKEKNRQPYFITPRLGLVTKRTILLDDTSPEYP